MNLLEVVTYALVGLVFWVLVMAVAILLYVQWRMKD